MPYNAVVDKGECRSQDASFPLSGPSQNHTNQFVAVPMRAPDSGIKLHNQLQGRQRGYKVWPNYKLPYYGIRQP